MNIIRFSDLCAQGKVQGQRVFIRADLNVPLNDAGEITEDTRVRASVPAIEMALKAGAAVMVTSHLGRPTEGEFKPADSLAPVAKRLGELLGREVPLVANWVDGVDVAPGACVTAYHWAGMNWDDAVMFMFTTMSLSGITPYDQSIGYFNSPAIEMVAVAFIVFSGFNFSLHFTAWRQRSISAYFTDIEARSWLFVLLIGISIVFGVLTFNHVYPTWEITLRHAVFNVASLFSTTGYTTENYELWPSSLGFLLLIGSLFASCSGSTGGGVKMIRMLIFVKQAILCLHTLLRPRDFLPLRLGKHTISNNLAANVSAFFALHVSVVLVCTLLIMFSGVNLTEAFSTVLACIANTGPGLGSVGPAGNYASCNPMHLWVGSFCMFVGRLELFTVFVIFTRSFWRS